MLTVNSAHAQFKEDKFDTFVIDENKEIIESDKQQQPGTGRLP